MADQDTAFQCSFEMQTLATTLSY